VARTLRTRFDQKARATHAMTRAQWVILSRLDRQPGMSQNEMAAICEVEPITVARLIDRLEARGLVERRADPTDRRIKRLHLLPAAKPILETINHSRELMNERIISGLDAKTRETLIDALLVIKENLANEALTGGKLAAVGE
jgi:DNA-binding MarR family transcriptional regulator